jgi:hypothetical protein
MRGPLDADCRVDPNGSPVCCIQDKTGGIVTSACPYERKRTNLVLHLGQGLLGGDEQDWGTTFQDPSYEEWKRLHGREFARYYGLQVWPWSWLWSSPRTQEL